MVKGSIFVGSPFTSEHYSVVVNSYSALRSREMVKGFDLLWRSGSNLRLLALIFFFSAIFVFHQLLFIFG